MKKIVAGIGSFVLLAGLYLGWEIQQANIRAEEAEKAKLDEISASCETFYFNLSIESVENQEDLDEHKKILTGLKAMRALPAPGGETRFKNLLGNVIDSYESYINSDGSGGARYLLEMAKLDSWCLPFLKTNPYTRG